MTVTRQAATRGKLQEAFDIWYENHAKRYTHDEMAAMLKEPVSRRTFSWRLQEARAIGLTYSGKPLNEITPPPKPLDTDRPPEQIIDHLCDLYDKKSRKHRAKKWMPFTVNVDGPIGVCFFGDMHVENAGCDWVTLRDHLNKVADAECAYGIFMGDVKDNWVGRLQKYFRDHNISDQESEQLVEWLLDGSGVTWLLWLLGNHDDWNDYGKLIKRYARNICPVEDWRARFRLVFPNGREAKIDAAHDHKGHSQYNLLHGQKRVTLFEEMAHIVIGAHRHCWQLTKGQCEHTGFVYWLARAAGYKQIESGQFALRGQFGEQTTGQMIFAVFRPDQPDTSWITCYDNIDDGIRALEVARADWRAGLSVDQE